MGAVVASLQKVKGGEGGREKGGVERGLGLWEFR